MKKTLPFLAAALLLGGSLNAAAADLTLAVGKTGDSSWTYRIGTQIDFASSWFESDVGRLTGYWDLGYTYWSGEKTASNHSVSLAPVFVYEFAGENVRPFVEAGIGVALFADTEVAGNRMGSAFQFEDRIGAGLRFAGQEVGIRASHYSNAGLKQPNDGVESYSLHYRMRF
jgi:lipid A 3-O-deacylase